MTDAIVTGIEALTRSDDGTLVIDTSSSMTGQKIEDARNAALAFVAMIDLAPGRSQKKGQVIHSIGPINRVSQLFEQLFENLRFKPARIPGSAGH